METCKRAKLQQQLRMHWLAPTHCELLDCCWAEKWHVRVHPLCGESAVDHTQSQLHNCARHAGDVTASCIQEYKLIVCMLFHGPSCL